MQLKSIREARDLKGKTVLLRVAYDVPLKQFGKRWVVADNRRILETVPTIEYLLKRQCKIVIMTWLGRPDGKVVDQYKLDPVAAALSKIIKRPVAKVDDCIGPKAFAAIKRLKPKDIVVLENTRFHREEERNGRIFSKLLVHGCDLIVFDAFAQAHRVHASTSGIMKLLPAYAGFLLEKEVNALRNVIDRPAHPVVIVLGGAKLSDKIATLQHLITVADTVLIGGAAANVFLQARRIAIGDSFIQDKFVDGAKRKKKVSAVKIAKRLLQRYGTKIVLPQDMVSVNKIDTHSLVEPINLATDRIHAAWKFVDIGPKTVKEFVRIIKSGKTIFWNGPMGVFEIDRFAEGTKKIAQAIAASKAVSVVGGGDTEAVLAKYKLQKRFTHVSTGGGASLEFLAGKELPALKQLIKH